MKKLELINFCGFICNFVILNFAELGQIQSQKSGSSFQTTRSVADDESSLEIVYVVVVVVVVVVVTHFNFCKGEEGKTCG